MRRASFIGGLATFGVAAVLAAPAGAATPAQVYKDFASHGKLTKNYSQNDLRATLRDAAVEGYGNPTVVVMLRPVIHQQLTRPQTAGVLGVQKTVARRPLAAVAQRGTLPFTGMQLTLLVMVGGALLGSGLLLRASAARGRS